MKIQILLALLLVFTNASGQAPDYEWIKQVGSYYGIVAYDIDVDNSGNSYITGTLSGSAYFHNDSVASLGAFDFFLAKFDYQGNFVWCKQVGGSPYARGNSLAIDNNGNCYVTGYFEGTSAFGIISMTSNGSREAFIAKYDPNGTVLWVKAAGGISFDEGHRITVDEQGNSYTAGTFFGTVTFGGLAVTGNSGPTIFIAKHDPAGNIIWLKKADGNFDSIGDLKVDYLGNLFFSGTHEGSASFANITLISNSRNSFIAKYNSIGEPAWVKSLGGTGMDFGGGVAIDSHGNSYFNGIFHSTANFGGNVLISSGATDVYIIKCDPLGNISWASKIGGVGNEFCSEMVVDSQGGLYFTGAFSNSFVSNSITFASNGNKDLYIIRYDSTGTIVWAKTAGGLSYDQGFGLAIDQLDAIYLTGVFIDSATFDGTLLSSSHASTMFVAKLEAVNPTINTGNVSSVAYCQGATIRVPFTANGDYSSTNVFIAQLSDASGGFSSPTAIGSLQTVTSDTIEAIIPINQLRGVGYRLRVVSTSPVISGSNNGISIAIQALPVVEVTAGANPVCEGQSTIITASGAEMFIWNNGFSDPAFSASPTAVTTYNVTGINVHGCSTNASITLTLASIPIVTTNAFPQAVCEGSPTVLSASGASAYTWSSGQSGAVVTMLPFASETYTVIGTTEHGCSAEATATVVVNSMPSPMFSYHASGLNVQITNYSTDGYEYTYNFGDNSADSFDEDPNHIYEACGQYIITQTVTSAEGCRATTNKTVTVLNGIPTFPELPINVYPTLTSGEVSIELVGLCGESPMKVEIYNTLGQHLLEKPISEGEVTKINLNHLSNGVYFIRILQASTTTVWPVVLQQ